MGSRPVLDFPLGLLGRDLMAPIHSGVQLVRRRVVGQPLTDIEERLGAGDVGPGGGDLDVLAEPSVVGPGAIGCEVEAADRCGEAAGPPAAERVELAPLEVVVVGAHEAAPRLEVRDLEAVATGVAESEADLGVCAGLDHGSRAHVQRVNTLILLYSNWVKILKSLFLFAG